MKRTVLTCFAALLLSCLMVFLFSCKKPEQPAPKEKLSWEELFLFEYAQESESWLFNKSSELEDPGAYDFGEYGAHNLFDDDPATCWAEGTSGDGIGEFIFFKISGGIDRIIIMNGYGKSKDIFEKNNRVKALKASLYVGINRPADATELGLYFQSVKFEEEAELQVDDTMSKQSIHFPFDWSKIRKLRSRAMDEYLDMHGKELAEQRIDKEDLTVSYILWLEIEDIYKGSTYDDCCISGIGWR